MKNRLFVIVGALTLVAAIAVPVIAYVSLAPAPLPAVRFVAVLGTPGDHAPDDRLPALATEIVYDDEHDRIVSHQENGDVVLWNLTDRAPEIIAYTDSAFGYCRAGAAMIIAKENRVTLLNLAHASDPATHGNRRVTEGAYDHAVWNSDCSRFALAGTGSRAVDVWSATLAVREVTLETALPVQNGLAISGNGRFIAAAQGSGRDAGTRETRLEVYEIAADLTVTPTPVPDGPGATDGMRDMVFQPDSTTLFTGAQTPEGPALLGVSARTGDTVWRHDGSGAYRVRAIAVSPDGKRLATGDGDGNLRLWNADNGALLFEGRTGLVIQSLSFSGNGRKLAVALWDATIGIVDVDDLATLVGPTG